MRPGRVGRVLGSSRHGSSPSPITHSPDDAEVDDSCVTHQIPLPEHSRGAESQAAETTVSEIGIEELRRKLQATEDTSLGAQAFERVPHTRAHSLCSKCMMIFLSS